MKRVLIASANPWSFALAVEREMIALNAGARVDAIDLFKLCGSYSPHWRRRDVWIERINRKYSRFIRPLINGRDITNAIKPDERPVPPVPSDLSHLRSYRVGDARIGLAVLSSITTITTVNDPGHPWEYGWVLPAAWKSAHLSARIGESVRKIGYDEIHIFNGRVCYARPFCDVLDGHSIVLRYEQGATGNSFVQADQPINHPITTARLIREHDFNPLDGESFYLDRLRKAPGDAVNFYTASQQEGFLPEGLRQGGFVAFFTSSQDEFLALSDDVGFGEFANQFEAAKVLASVAAEQGLRLVLRLHPHLQYKHESWRREWDFEELNRLGVHVIAPGDPYDSYALAAAAHCVFSCGSTVGFESSFRGIPNADIGDWVGSKLGAMERVLDRASVARFMAHPRLPATARHAALLYGSFIRRGGMKIPSLEVGSHPYYARIDGIVVDPVRYVIQRVRDVVARRQRPRLEGIVAGKIMIDPHLEARARAEIARAKAD